MNLLALTQIALAVEGECGGDRELAKRCCAYLAYRLTDASLPQIGRCAGETNLAVLHAIVRAVQGKVDEESISTCAALHGAMRRCGMEVTRWGLISGPRPHPPRDWSPAPVSMHKSIRFRVARQIDGRDVARLRRLVESELPPVTRIEKGDHVWFPPMSAVGPRR